MPELSNTTITKSVIDRAKPRDKTYEIRDSELRGFILRVYPTGKKVFVVQLERNQRRKVSNVALTTITAARLKAKKMQVKHHAGEIIESKRNVTPSLKDFIECEYLEEIRLVHKQPDKSIARILSTTKTIADLKLHELSEFDLRKWKKNRIESGICKATFNRELASLKKALNIAVELRLIVNNPANQIKLYKNVTKNVERYLKQDERKRLFSALNDRDAEMRAKRDRFNKWRLERNKTPLPLFGTFADYLEPIILVALNTGLRKGEVLSLKWKDIQLKTNPRLTVNWQIAKSDKTRHIPLNSPTVNVLRKWRNQTSTKGLVFHRNGKQMREIKSSWENLMKRADIQNFRFHDLRHDFASQLVMGGVDLYRVKELLGHSSIETTQRYAHLSPERLQDAVATLNSIYTS